MKRMQIKQMNIRSKRTAQMTETLNNIRRYAYQSTAVETQKFIGRIHSIKLYGWEYAFMRKIAEVRTEELAQLKKIGLTIVHHPKLPFVEVTLIALQALNLTTWQAAPVVVAFCTFVVCAYASDLVLTPSVIFPAFALLNLLQFPLMNVSLFRLSMTNTVVFMIKSSSARHFPPLLKDPCL